MALLDDPIQNMDDFNLVGLLDMLRSLLPLRQLLISTHDMALGTDKPWIISGIAG